MTLSLSPAQCNSKGLFYKLSMARRFSQVHIQHQLMDALFLYQLVLRILPLIADTVSYNVLCNFFAISARQHRNESAYKTAHLSKRLSSEIDFVENQVQSSERVLLGHNRCEFGVSKRVGKRPDLAWVS